MRKFLMLFIISLSILAAAAVGCEKKEYTQEPELTMPISVSIEEAIPHDVAMEPFETEETGPTAEEIQQALTNAGFYTYAVDGKIGPKTKKAITEFQKQNDLVTDGKVGKRTWKKLKIYLE